MNVVVKKNQIFLQGALLLSTLFMLSCAPPPAQNTPHNLDDISTGGTTQVVNPFPDAPNSHLIEEEQISDDSTIQKPATTATPGPENKTVEVNYIKAIDQESFEQVKQNLELQAPEKREQSKNQLARHIKDAQFNFYKNKNLIKDYQQADSLEVIFKIANDLHIFTASPGHFSEVIGKQTKHLPARSQFKNLPDSPLHATLICNNSDCTSANIKLHSIKKDENNEPELSASIGYTKTRVRLEVQPGIDNKEDLEQYEFYQALKNYSETHPEDPYPAESIAITVGDGKSFKKITQKGVGEISTSITDPRKSAAKLNPKSTTLQGAQVKESVYNGLTREGSFIIDTVIEHDDKTPTKVAPPQPPVVQAPPATESIKTTEPSLPVTPTAPVQTSATHRARIEVITQEDDQKRQEQELNKNFHLEDVKSLIHSGNADWGDVGVNPQTALFFSDHYSPDKKQQILITEAHLEEHRVKKEDINSGTLNHLCNTFIPRMAAARHIIANSFVSLNTNPSFASIVKIESEYGFGNGYPMQVACGESSSGLMQITNGTADWMSELVQPLIDKKTIEVTTNEFNFVRKHPIKNNNCEVTNYVEMHQQDARMSVEPASMLAGAYFDYIVTKKHSHDPALAYAAYNRGQSFYTQFRAGDRNQNFPTTLSGILRYNMDQVNYSWAKGYDSDPEGAMQKTIADSKAGTSYALEALAIRSVLTQPENYCESYSDPQVLIDLYKKGEQQLKNQDAVEEMKLFSPVHGPVLKVNKALTH